MISTTAVDVVALVLLYNVCLILGEPFPALQRPKFHVGRMEFNDGSV